jgi:hypothetical protein
MKVVLSTFVIIAASFIVGCQSPSRYPIDEKPLVDTKNKFLGDWKMQEDPDKKNFIRLEDYHEKFKDVDAFTYHVQIWDRSGTNRTYEFNIFFSEIGNTRFINVYNWMAADWMDNQHYILLKIVDVSPAFDKITAVAASAPALAMVNNSKEVREILTRNLDNPSFYKDTVHFYKVK